MTFFLGYFPPPRRHSFGNKHDTQQFFFHKLTSHAIECHAHVIFLISMAFSPIPLNSSIHIRRELFGLIMSSSNFVIHSNFKLDKMWDIFQYPKSIVVHQPDDIMWAWACDVSKKATWIWNVIMTRPITLYQNVVWLFHVLLIRAIDKSTLLYNQFFPQFE